MTLYIFSEKKQITGVVREKPQGGGVFFYASLISDQKSKFLEIQILVISRIFEVGF